MAAHGSIGHHGHHATPLIERYLHNPHPQPAVEHVYHQQNLRRNSIQHQQHFPPNAPPTVNHHRVENVKVEITEVKP